MTAMSVTEDKAALVSQCLDFCQTLANKWPTFSFTLTLGDSFSFSLDTNGKDASASKGKKKKKTPSTLRRDAKRRSKFLNKKLEVSTVDTSSLSENVSEEEAFEEVVEKRVFKCDQCENIFKSENGLKIHIGKAHKKVNSIPSTPDQLRQQMDDSVSLSASPLLNTSREESSAISQEPPECEPEIVIKKPGVCGNGCGCERGMLCRFRKPDFMRNYVKK